MSAILGVAVGIWPSVIGVICVLIAMGRHGAFPVFLTSMAIDFVFVAITEVDETKSEATHSIGNSKALLSLLINSLAVLRHHHYRLSGRWSDQR